METRPYHRTEEEERRARAAREQADADLNWLMSEPRGRRLMFKLLSEAGVFRTTYNPAAKDPSLEMATAEGRKHLGYVAMARINAVCPEQYFQMMKESNDGRIDKRSAVRSTEPAE